MNCLHFFHAFLGKHKICLHNCHNSLIYYRLRLAQILKRSQAADQTRSRASVANAKTNRSKFWKMKCNPVLLRLCSIVTLIAEYCCGQPPTFSSTSQFNSNWFHWTNMTFHTVHFSSGKVYVQYCIEGSSYFWITKPLACVLMMNPMIGNMLHMLDWVCSVRIKLTHFGHSSFI